MGVNAQYNVAKPDSLAVKIAARQREKMFAAFLEATAIDAQDTVLDVGATSDRSYNHSNYLAAWCPNKARITEVGIDDASFLEELYPGLRFVQGDGRDLPFNNASFDFVHSSAVLEHVGSRGNQVRFLSELWRVSRKGIFVTTPNRWFPVEFHTILPLLHWLPAPVFRRILPALGRGFFSDENNLNLLSPGTLAEAAAAAGLAHWRITSVALFGYATNLLLIADKRPPAPARRAGQIRTTTS
jgi:ubiquinone/menaquinone biosynthesis C-methylase UbiE